jgi:hypothetical protein
MTSDTDSVVDAEHAGFLQRGVGISVAACDSDNVPTLVRACGCCVSDDRRRITVFVSATQAAPLLKCIRKNGAVAVVFSEPSTHRTVQIKGSDTVVGGLADGDLQAITGYRSAFARELATLGYDEILVRTLFSYPSADVVGLSFTPSEAYSQTPGPKAGEPLRRAE